jgi:hypothetical protein
MSFWEPQLGPQLKAVTCPVDFVFFGGSRGGGKSDCLIGRQLNGAEKYTKHWNGLIIRRKYKDFRELRRRWDELISEGLPAERTGGENQTNYINFKDGAIVTMPAINQLQQVNDFVGHQYTEISIDECTTFPFFVQMVDKLKGSNRSPHGVPCRMFGTGNPGGPGHNAVKEYFKLGSAGVPPETIIYTELGDGMRESRIFIPSFLDDNKILCYNDPLYVARLKSISDPALRRAWLQGDWDVFIGQAFNLTKQYHIIKPIPVPEGAPIYTTFDWGFGKPFSWGWWWIDNDGRAYRFAEWYGCEDGVPDQGLRLTDSQVAEEINERERKLGISKRDVVSRLAGPDCFSKKPDYKGGGQGPPTAEVFAQHGLYLSPGDPSRELKIRQFRERLKVPTDSDGAVIDAPMLRVYSTCTAFIRTISALCMDEMNPEDIDCFVAGTLIDTPGGKIKIEDISPGQLVCTPIGPREVTKAYASGAAFTTKITLSNGMSIEGTNAHKIFIKDVGLLPLCMVSSNDEITTQEDTKWLTALFTEESNSLSVKTEDILSVIHIMRIDLALRYSIGLYGKMRMDQSRMDNISTIKTTTPPTTALKTLNSLIRRSMLDTITKNALLPVGIFEPRLIPGVGVSEEKGFLGGILKNAVRTLPNENLRALIVANLLKRGTQQQNTVLKDAESSPGCWRSPVPSAEKPSELKSITQNRSKPVVTSVVGSSEEKTVYNITVRQAHLFYANGLLATNTDQEDHIYDEACHICMARPINMPNAKPKKSSYDKRIENLYRGDQDDYEENAAYEQEWAMRYLGAGESDIDAEEYDDGDLVRTI